MIKTVQCSIIPQQEYRP